MKLDDFQEKVVDLTEKLANVAVDKEGGITRLLYTDQWVRSQNVLKEIMEDYGMTTNYDEVGNLYGRYVGKNREETILTGSHVDTVVCGGKYDGMYGILAGIIALHGLHQAYGQPSKNMEVVSFAEEEGSRFPTVFWGSKNLLGMEDTATAKTLKDRSGIGFTYKMMHSGAGHDAQLVATKVPTAMLFVPSKDGISHNPAEHTDPDLLAKGVAVLAETIHSLAYGNL